jgi:hypothetical protein
MDTSPNEITPEAIARAAIAPSHFPKELHPGLSSFDIVTWSIRQDEEFDETTAWRRKSAEETAAKAGGSSYRRKRIHHARTSRSRLNGLQLFCRHGRRVRRASRRAASAP